jgi:hypothetical protein
MKDSLPKFKMSDVRKCFSTVGDTTLSKWLDKGLVPHHSYKKGIRGIVRYSALEIVHVGILTQLSTWGILTYYKDTVAWGGFLSIEDILLTAHGGNTSLPPEHQFQNISLTEPSKMVEYYRAYGPDLTMIVTSCEVPIEQEDKRMRRTKTQFWINVLAHKLVGLWERENLTLKQLEKTEKERADVYKSFGFLKLDVDRVISHVYSQLDMLRLLD